MNYQHEEEFYQTIVAEMSKQFEFSSAWTFSRKGGGLIDEYIINNEEYVGIGSGAFSYLDGGLYVNTFSIDQYIRCVDAGKHPITGKRIYGRMDQMRYRFMMELFGLRLDKKAWIERFGHSIERSLPAEMAFFQARGAFAVNNSEELILSSTGRYMLIIMMREFFAGINRVRDQARQAIFELGGEKATQAALHPQP
jgi:coproporphyrinogen III oxidase-like Fe-S oxidoreductase